MFRYNQENDARLDPQQLNTRINNEVNGNVNYGFDSDIKLDKDNLNSYTITTLPQKDVESNPKETDQKPEKERAQWGNSLEFLMSCIAMSVGLGNIWRFPFTAYENGGGAFLIPYVIVLFIVGRPVYYLEMCLGQFTGKGNVQMFESMAPALKGMGYGQLVAGIATATYYSSIMALTLFYLFSSFSTNLPWSECRPEWAQFSCVSSNGANNLTNITNGSVSSSELFFNKEVLQTIDSIDNGIGLPEWRLSLCLLLSWIVTFAVTMRGVKSSGKVSYFLAIFPYVILITLLIRGSTLDGAWDGIKYFLKPDFYKLLSVKVWYEAIVQCFFSLTAGFGTITMYSSYNSFDHNVHRDALIVSVMDTFTSVLAGVTIFGILGNLAFKLDVDVAEVIKTGGAGLAFISYPEAIARFESVPWLFSILFFFMLFTLGIGSLISLQTCVITVIKDTFPHLKSWQVSAGFSVICFFLGLVYVTPGGSFILQLVDHFGGTFILFVLTTLEVVLVMWWYGVDSFCLDIEFMLKRKVGWYWRLCWGIITPTAMVIILIYFLSTVERLTYGTGKVLFPISVEVIGWMILAVAIAQIFIWWGIYLMKNKKLGTKTAFESSLAHSMWRPKTNNDYKEWKEWKEEVLSKRNSENPTWLVKTRQFFLGR